LNCALLVAKCCDYVLFGHAAIVRESLILRYILQGELAT
jgi:hypothetical protein